MSNPYQSPQLANQPTQPFVPGIDREKLRRVAKYQQWVLYALLAGVVIYFVAGATMRAPMAIRFPISMLFLAIGLFSMVAIFLLTNEMSNPIVGILCALLMILPCVGLLALAFVNARATAYLQQHGVKVGFMGASPNSI